MRLEHGEAVPGDRPNTWVHVPAARDAARDLRLAFVFHGFKNCIASYTGTGVPCSKHDGMKRPGYALAEQLEREGSHSIVVVSEQHRRPFPRGRRRGARFRRRNASARHPLHAERRRAADEPRPARSGASRRGRPRKPRALPERSAARGAARSALRPARRRRPRRGRAAQPRSGDRRGRVVSPHCA